MKVELYDRANDIEFTAEIDFPNTTREYISLENASEPITNERAEEIANQPGNFREIQEKLEEFARELKEDKW